MRAVLGIFLSALFLVAVTDARQRPHGHFEAYQLFLEFEQNFAKEYSSQTERLARFDIFRRNLDVVARLNEENGSPAFGVTKFMDLTQEEFRAAYLLPVPLDISKMPQGPVLPVPKTPLSIPPSWDWRNKSGVISAVKNQAQCGSCWAFFATEQIESMWVLGGNTPVELAPQQIVDCDKTCYGCGGGWTQKAFAYVITAGGQEDENDYPYVARNTQCTFDSSKVAAKIGNWSYVSQSANTENTTMLNYVANNGPLSVCVDAATWQYYTKGVLQKCGTSIDHCVQVTGYSTQDGVDVWNVRNSWAANWGVDGYIYVPRGRNMCLIATVATTVAAN
jgi:C1A family cysteine protease